MLQFAACKRRLLGPAVLLLALLGACGERQDPAALQLSGRELAAKRDHAGAIIQYRAALQKDPNSAALRVLLAQSLLATGDAQGAQVELARAQSEGAPINEVAPLMARALIGLEDHKRLVQTYGNTVLDDRKAQAALQTDLALAWSRLSNPSKAEAALALALEADGNHLPALVLRGQLDSAAGKEQSALEAARKAIAADGTSPRGWHLQGELLAAKGEFAAAEASYKKAVELDGAYLPARGGLFSLALAQSDLPKAQAQAAEMKRVAPVHPATAYVEATLALHQGDLTVARDKLQRLLSAIPEDEGVLVAAGLAEARSGNSTQASALLAKALSLNPRLAIARESLAEVEVRLGQYAKAMNTLKPALAGEGQPRALAIAAHAELRRGNLVVAQQYFERAARLAPKDTRIQAAMLMSKAGTDGGVGAMAGLQSLVQQSTDVAAEEALFTLRLRRGEFDAALATLDSIQAKRPGRAGDEELRGQVQLARRDTAAARQAFEKALKIDPSSLSTMRYLVALDLREGKPQQAVQRIQSLVTANPKNAFALLMLADLKERSGASAQEVRQYLLDAAAAAPSLPEPRLALLLHTSRKRQYKEALDHARNALAAIPNDISILDAAGQVQLKAGEHEQALTTFRKLAAGLPDSAAPYVRIAEAYVAAGKMDQAEVALRRGLDLEPANPSAQAALVDVLLASNQTRNAVEYVQSLKRARPNMPLNYALEAGVHERKGAFEQALAALREGVAVTGNSGLAVRQFLLLVNRGRAEEAGRLAEAWLAKNPKDAAFEYAVAEWDIAKGNLKQAETRLRRVVAALPADAMALNNLAGVIFQQGGQGAVEFAQRAVDISPDRPVFMDTLAAALARDGQVQQALDLQRRAVDLAPEDPYLKLGLARIALQAGDKRAAKAELDKLKELGSKFRAQPEVDSLMKRL